MGKRAFCLSLEIGDSCSDNQGSGLGRRARAEMGGGEDLGKNKLSLSGESSGTPFGVGGYFGQT